MQLSDKQKEFWNFASHRWNIKQGATRSGKTYLDFYMIPRRIRACVGAGLICIIGNTKATVERNILEPMRDIYGELLVGRTGSDNRCRMFGKTVHVLGAEKSNAVTKLQGAGIEYCYGDEVTTWHEDVFTMLKSRLDKGNSCFDGTCNPDNPNHWFKTFLDSDADIFLQTYTIDDNPFLSPVFVENLKREYYGSVYYDRFILGRWVPAEGIIYRQFADDPDSFIISRAPEIKFASIGVDFGGNQSAHAFVCNGYTKNFKEVITLDEVYIKEKISPDRLNFAFIQFVRKCLAQYPVHEVFCDSAETTLIQGLKAAAVSDKLPVNIKNAKKSRITDRIRFYNTIMAQGRYKVLRNCTHVIDALRSAVWDDKKLEDTRLDDGKMNVDSLDALEYATERYMKSIIEIGGILH